MMEPTKIETLAELEQEHPELASIVKTVATVSAQNVEKHMGDLPGERKKELAQQEAESILNQLFDPQTEEEKAKARELLKNVYHFADFVFDLPPVVDKGAELLIPLLPEAFDWVVTFLNGIGQFFSGAKGVQ